MDCSPGEKPRWNTRTPRGFKFIQLGVNFTVFNYMCTTERSNFKWIYLGVCLCTFLRHRHFKNKTLDVETIIQKYKYIAFVDSLSRRHLQPTFEHSFTLLYHYNFQVSFSLWVNASAESRLHINAKLSFIGRPLRTHNA